MGFRDTNLLGSGGRLSFGCSGLLRSSGRCLLCGRLLLSGSGLLGCCGFLLGSRLLRSGSLLDLGGRGRLVLLVQLDGTGRALGLNEVAIGNTALESLVELRVEVILNVEVGLDIFLDGLTALRILV